MIAKKNEQQKRQMLDTRLSHVADHIKGKGNEWVGKLPQGDQKRRRPEEACDEREWVGKTCRPCRLGQKEESTANLEGQGPCEIPPDSEVEERTKQAGKTDQLGSVGDDILKFVF